MCLIALSIGQHPRFPLVVAANRDEFFDRPSAPLAWWRPPGAGEPILAGRDLRAGGTWLGLSRSGRLAMLTNVREPANHDPQARSRGGIVPEWLGGNLSTAAFCARQLAGGYNGFNLLVADLRARRCVWASNRAGAPRTLSPGLHAVSNELLDTPWPKVQVLKARMAQALSRTASVQSLAARLFDALADRHPAPDDALPRTGIDPRWEKLLSAAFIHSAERGYGTRCSTLVITEALADGRHATHVFERSFDAQGEPASLRSEVLADWPPRGAGPVGAPVNVAQPDSARTISTCGTPASSNTGPRSAKPART